METAGTRRHRGKRNMMGGVLRGGKTAAELAEMVGKSPRTIVREFSEPREDYLRRAEKRGEAVLRLRKEGMTIRAIADEVGVSIGTVHRHIKRAREDGTLGA